MKLPPIDFGGDSQAWLVTQATQYNLQYLLAHADDGVNWGIIDSGQVTVSHDRYPDYAPELRLATLQQVRLFGNGGELYLWRVDDQWHGRFLDGTRAIRRQTHFPRPICFGAPARIQGKN